MTQTQDKPKVQYYEVFSISEYVRGGEAKSAWIRIGAAFQNRDGSFNVRLRALPLTDPKTGMANLHMRLHQPQEAGAEDDGDSFYLEIDPLMGAPLEAL